MSILHSIPSVFPQHASILLVAVFSALLSVVMLFSWYLCRSSMRSYQGRGVQVNRKSRNRELPSEYAFSATTAVRALETTYLPYIAPPRPDVRRVQPIIFRAFERAGKQRYVLPSLAAELSKTKFCRLAQELMPLEQNSARPVSHSRSSTPLLSASRATSSHIHATPQRVSVFAAMDSAASQSPKGGRVRFAGDNAERKVTPLASSSTSAAPIDVR